ncbi:MAG: ribbon-helix-helix protein, CopG family [Bacteroidetes bacterium]|nr:ribbon-helix-helix protein, CopG family [Bacteroidota bacterium]
MNTKKVAMTIPEDLLGEIDEMSKIRGVSRSRLISELLREKLIDEQNRSLRSAYDEVFSNETICNEQALITANSES